MATRLYTAFVMPNNESIVDERPKFWVDVQEDYQTVFDQIFPVYHPVSTLEARSKFEFTKVEDGKRFACMTPQVVGFEELD